MSVKVLSWFSGCLFGLGAGIWLHAAAAPAHAQEKPERETRQWHVSMIPFAGGENGGGPGGYRAVRVDVIDTEGVCLYVARTFVGDGKAPAITAVPKTQLPKGAGCQ